MSIRRCMIKIVTFFIVLMHFSFASDEPVLAQDDVLQLPSINFNIGTQSPNNADGTAQPAQPASTTLQILFLLTILSLAPSILIMFTCFTRIIISLHFLRAALGTQQMPPNQIMIGLALFLTFFLMGPTFTEINDTALKPYSEGQITQSQFIDQAMEPIRDFMFSQVENKDLGLFLELAEIQSFETRDDIPTRVLIPAFILGEITKAFKIGFILYIPFIVIDMVVASTLMGMGMMMLPPALISAPFKILFFIMADGWTLVIRGIIKTF